MQMKIYTRKSVRKVLAILIILTMTLTNIMYLGKELISYAFEEDFESQGITTQSANVNFDAYLVNTAGESTHTIIFDCLKDKPKINLGIAVRNAGYIKDAYIEFKDELNTNNLNYKLPEKVENTSLVQNINTTLNTIALKRIDYGTTAIIELPIALDMTETINIEKLNQNSHVLFRGIYVDANGKQVEISKTVKLNIGWTITDNIILEQSIEKYIPTAENILIQTKAVLKQTNEGVALPVRSTQIKAKVERINDNLPQKIVVTQASTSATNGNKIRFTSDNWSYNEEEETVTINVSGYENDKFVWSGAGIDEYYITYIYPSQEIPEELVLHCDMEAKMQLISGQGIIEKTNTSVGDVTLTEKIADIVSYKVDAIENQISKGKMYANYNSETKTYNTQYNSELAINISKFENIDSLYVDMQSDEFIGEENNYSANIGGVNFAVYKQIKISKDKVNEILGEDGIIKIFADETVYEINNETEDIDGVYIVNFEDSIQDLKISTSKPIADGILKIEVSNEISKNLPYTKEQVIEFEKIKINAQGYVKYQENDNYYPTASIADTIELTETHTKAELKLSTTSISAISQNQNVEFDIILNNNEENSDLYKNAVFTISLPKYIEDIEVTGGNILYTDGLEIDYLEKNFTQDGIQLVLYTKGAEKTFSDGVLTNGTNIVLYTNLKISDQTPNVVAPVVLTYTNENAISYSNDGTDKVNINFIAPEEIVVLNSVLASGVETVSKGGNINVAQLETLDVGKIATMKICLLNKYSDVCSNIKILGRTPFAGNKSIETEEDLGSTFDAKLISQINTYGKDAIVYYSSNEEATANIKDEDNLWTTNLEEVDSIKSYLITLPNYEMESGEKLEFTYNCEVPGNLEYNESSYGTYAVYFDNVAEYETSNVVEATRVGLATGTRAEIEMSTEVTSGGRTITSEDYINEYQTVTYKTTIRNTGTIDAENIVLKSVLKNGYIVDNPDKSNVVEKTWTIEKIRAGESIDIECNVEARILVEEDLLTNDLTLTADNFEGPLSSQYTNEVRNAKLRLFIQANNLNDRINKSDIVLFLYVMNETDQAIENITITSEIPEGLKYIESLDERVCYNEETNIMTINISSIEANSSDIIQYRLMADIPNNVSKIETVTKLKAVINDNEIYESNLLKINVVAPLLEINLNGDVQNNTYIKEGSKLEITGTIKNIGEIADEYAIVEFYVPEELEVESIYYIIEGNEQKPIEKVNFGKYRAMINLDKDSIATVKITATTTLSEDKDKTIEINAKAYSELFKEITSNTLTYTIEKTTTPGFIIDDDPTPSVPVYKISGLVWLDENSDGERQIDEKLLEGISTVLIDANTGVIVTDILNGTIKQTTTGVSGKYEFSNVPAGQYIVVFEYDTALYEATQFSKEGVADDLSSKAIQSEITKNGKLKYAGITNTINITDVSVGNINLGLIEKEKFDLSLKMEIGGATISNNSGTTSYTFDNPKLGKVDVKANDLNSTTAQIHYKITVKNEGAVEGYAKKIVDYKPKDLDFDINVNSGWYIGSDGNLYNNSLANTIIKPRRIKRTDININKENDRK